MRELWQDDQRAMATINRTWFHTSTGHRFREIRMDLLKRAPAKNTAGAYRDADLIMLAKEK